MSLYSGLHQLHKKKLSLSTNTLNFINYLVISSGHIIGYVFKLKVLNFFTCTVNCGENGLLSVSLNPKTKDVYKQGHISSQYEEGSQQIL